MTTKTHSNLARLQATQAHAPLPPRLATGIEGATRGTVAGDVIAGIEGDQRFLHLYSTAGPQAPNMLRAPASAWQAACIGQFDGMCWNFAATKSNGTDTLAPGAFAMDGTLGVGGDFVHAVPTGEIAGGPLLGLWTDQIWVGGGVGYVDAAAHVGARLGLMLSGRLHNSVDVALPGLPRGANQQPAAPQADVHVEEHSRWQVAWMPALGLFDWLRILCRTDNIGSTDSVYDAKIDLAAASLLSAASTSAFYRWIVGTWRALWGLHPLPIPALEHPERLAVGESRTTTFGARTSMMGSVGAWLVYGGYQRSKVHQSAVNTKRVEADLVEITWTQTRVGSDRTFGVVPGGIGMDWGRHSPTVKTATFTIALNPQSIAAYRDFVQVLKSSKTPKQEQAAFDALLANDAFQRALQAPPALTESRGKSRSSEVGARVYMFPSTFWDTVLPRGFTMALAANTERREFTHVTGTVGASDETRLNIVLNQRQRLLGPNGTRQSDIVAVVEEKRDGGTLKDAAVVVGSRFQLSRADASEVQRHIINPLNNHFDAQLAPLAGAGWRVSREVSVERRLDRHDLSALATLSPKQRTLVCERSGAAASALDALVETLYKLPLIGDVPVEAIHAGCVAVQTFVDEAGLPGLGALRHALGENPDEAQRWTVTSDSDAYSAPAEAIGSLRSRTLDASALSSKSFAKAQRHVERSLSAAGMLLASDPFVDSEARGAALQRLAEQQAELSTLPQSVHSPVSKEAARLALDVQRFLRTHSEPRFCDATATDKALRDCAPLVARLRGLAHDETLDHLMRPWTELI